MRTQLFTQPTSQLVEFLNFQIKDHWLSLHIQDHKVKKQSERKEKYYITVHWKKKNTLTFSSEEMVSLSLEIKLHTCSMPRLRNSSLSTTSAKCCSVWRLQRKPINAPFYYHSFKLLKKEEVFPNLTHEGENQVYFLKARTNKTNPNKLSWGSGLYLSDKVEAQAGR